MSKTEIFKYALYESFLNFISIVIAIVIISAKFVTNQKI